MSAKIEIEVSSLATVRSEQGADDRQRADQERQRRRDEAAEEEQREEEEDREREQLGALQVRLDLLVHLLLRDRVAADADAIGSSASAATSILAGFLDLVVVGRLEGDREVGRVAARETNAGIVGVAGTR